MPQYRQGNMLDHLKEADLLLFSANACLDSQGQLVMGGGIAKQVRDRWSGSAQSMGEILQQRKARDGHASQPFEAKGRAYQVYLRPYHILTHPEWPCNPQKKLGAFQSKIHWDQPSSLDLIHAACLELRCIVETLAYWRDIQVYLNFPGIGLGGLPREVVKADTLDPLLPDSVTVWELPPSSQI